MGRGATASGVVVWTLAVSLAARPVRFPVGAFASKFGMTTRDRLPADLARSTRPRTATDTASMERQSSLACDLLVMETSMPVTPGLPAAETCAVSGE
ncbi:hypothetical protein HPB52_020706 [Rhipicephalus sanguineus]|uniref:Secreted protein n=1 Tax=Rhipicephalus sanguineus TaxID=34632 RepID=A0A9D4SV61_RHISA|nr:hypothetical protein HPB52_020706 [Rhipicephalus sanguineus]